VSPDRPAGGKRRFVGAALPALGWRVAVALVTARETRGRLRSAWTTVNGLRLHALVPVEVHARHDVPPIVCVHGANVSGAYMIPTAVRLLPIYRVLLPDLPGYGRSDKPGRILDVPTLADVLVAWMDAVGIERAVLLANSLGCQIAADVAARYPNRVSHLILVGPTIDPAARTARQQIKRLLLDALRERRTLILLAQLDYLRAGPRRVVGTLRVALRDRIEEKLPRVTAPTLVVRGGRDVLVPQRWAEEVTRLLPNARLVVVPGSAHAVNYSRPDELATAVRQFLGVTA
jgi:2-hydroxy-6-oxonona-2,4-dienedioate hydrolase